MKEKHIDFIIEKTDDHIVKMRFYPQHSHCHGFYETPPKDWNEVYKVYYSWSILESHKGFIKDDEMWTAFEPVFEMKWDECSAITYLPDTIEWILKKKKNFYRLPTLGQPGSDWDFRYIKTCASKIYFDEQERGYLTNVVRTPENDVLEITVVNNCTQQAYHFLLTIDETQKFVSYLKKINQHMLENGEPI